jgi:hypothetical protein
MLLAVSDLDPTLKFLFFAVAIVLFLLAAFGVSARVSLLALGLAVFAFPFAWQALSAA